MSINIYPAFKVDGFITHADDWDDGSTLNVANGNFYPMIATMGLDRLVRVPGTVTIKTMELALATSPRTNYTDRLKAVCAVARIKRAQVIAFS